MGKAVVWSLLWAIRHIAEAKPSAQKEVSHVKAELQWENTCMLSSAFTSGLVGTGNVGEGKMRWRGGKVAVFYS